MVSPFICALPFVLMVVSSCSADLRKVVLDLGALKAPVRFMPSRAIPNDASCLSDGTVAIFGAVSDSDVSALLVMTEERNPLAPVVSVRVRGRYAEVSTAHGCDTPEETRGDNFLFQRSSGKWTLINVHETVSSNQALHRPQRAPVS